MNNLLGKGGGGYGWRIVSKFNIQEFSIHIQYSHSRKILIQLQQLYSHSRKIFIQLHQLTIVFTFKKNICSTSTICFCSTSSSKICIQSLNPQNPTCSQVTDQTQHGGNRRRYHFNVSQNRSDSWT